MQRYRIEVGHDHGVKPGQIMGALTNEAGLDGKFIGRIDIRAGHSLVDLPEGMPQEIFKALRKTRLCRQFLRITRDESGGYKGKGKGTLKAKPMAKGNSKSHPGSKSVGKPHAVTESGSESSMPPTSAPPKGPANPGPPGGLKPPRSAGGD